MQVAEDYNAWASAYDTVMNKTRDLEGVALRDMLGALSFRSVLEAGCGTGKNTSFFVDRAEHVLSVDFSAAMLAQAKEKIKSEKVEFKQADLMHAWTFLDRQVDLISFSLVLEHIPDLSTIFKNAYNTLNPGGYLYLGELHPFKQYAGSKARFETASGETRVLDCFTHHVSDYFNAAVKAGFICESLQEWFDDDAVHLPRVLTIVFRKPK
ncbi:class I SAM-dependent methyltransferase [Pseudochryseolinea flava]|uniref:SAM-dependent methyltransferase n=1 Tax=Pseudochryseolinea flava TaxID=2059302 RepID=A0A364XWG0_9BACT|nr:class I SAM-dependent methyltransferase [Pseudochryseolinea flava]RAV98488.1 SAM-dependent methyltransferase [Pseudochryseolinea flava]